MNFDWMSSINLQKLMINAVAVWFECRNFSYRTNSIRVHSGFNLIWFQFDGIKWIKFQQIKPELNCANENWIDRHAGIMLPQAISFFLQNLPLIKIAFIRSLSSFVCIPNSVIAEAASLNSPFLDLSALPSASKHSNRRRRDQK